MGETACCSQCIRWLMVLFNVVFLFCGISLTSFGVWSLVSTRLLSQFISSVLIKPTAISLIVVGVTITVIAFCGCSGAALENRCILIVFFIVMSILFTLFLVVTILVVVFSAEVKLGTQDYLSSLVRQNYGHDEKREFTELWNLIQYKFKCCAVVNNDYDLLRQTPWFPIKSTSSLVPVTKHSLLPDSCCPGYKPPRGSSDTKKSGLLSDDTLTFGVGNNNGILCRSGNVIGSDSAPYPEGCFTKLTRTMATYNFCYIGFVIGLLLIMVLAMIFSAVIMKQDNYYYYPVTEYNHM